MLSLCSLRSQGPSALARSPHSHASLPASPAVLASLAASPLLLSLRSRLSPLACLRFTRARRLSHLLRARSARCLSSCPRFAWAASPACSLRSPPHTPHTPAGAALSLRHPSALACCSLRSPPPRLLLAAGRSACYSLSHLLVLLARLTRLAC
mmetsp:Transcript_21832/g.49203  ORF Transcript_21832/g.49203 Transcript_21832/m.49203 type:complete len:153 (+) Transcript_21832:1141-1599(+)